MALRAAFAAQNQAINAEPVRDAVSTLIPNTGGLVQVGDYAVTQTGTPSMGVSVGAGRAWVPGTNVSNISGQTWSTQGQYNIINDAPYTASVATSDPTNPRIDVVYVAMQDSQYSGTANGPIIQVAAGTPTAGATYPANAPALPANSLALAWINVTAGKTSILNADITPIPTYCTHPFGHMGRTGGFQALTTSAATVVMAAAQTLRGGMTFSSSANGLIVPVAGLYRLTLKAYFSGAATTYIADALKNNANTGAEVRLAISSTDLVAGASVTVPCAVNDQLTIGAYTLASGSNNVWGTDGYNGIYLEAEYVGP